MKWNAFNNLVEVRWQKWKVVMVEKNWRDGQWKMINNQMKIVKFLDTLMVTTSEMVG